MDGKPEDMRKIAEITHKKRMQAMYEKQCEMREKMGLPPIEAPPGVKPYVAKGNVVMSEAQKKEEQKKMMKDQFKEMMDGEDEVPKIKFGDASVAAPFTSKITSVQSGTFLLII